MTIKGQYKPEMIVQALGRGYHVVVNIGSHQIDEESYELVNTSLVMKGEPTYSTLVSALIRKMYDADKMEAIVNNYLADSTDVDAKQEFDGMQAYRQEVKSFCKAVFDAIAEAERLKELEENPPIEEMEPPLDVES